ncbi:carboxypeptidase-like regulatory domain-containing protein [Streptomyces sp. NPDC055722]
MPPRGGATPLGVRGRRRENRLALFGAAAGHARVLATVADIDIDLSTALRTQVEQITDAFTESLHALDRQIATGRPLGAWVRVSPLIHEMQPSLRGLAGPRAERLNTALRELAALDEVPAHLADTHGLTVTIPRSPASYSPQTGAAAPWTVASGNHAAADHQTYAALGDRAGAHRPTKPQAPGGSIRTGRRRHAASADLPDAAKPAATHALAGNASHVADTTNPGVPQSGSTVTITGTVRCPCRPEGREVWITVVTGSGKQHTRVRSADGHYQITGLAPGPYTLLASSTAHTPHAEFLLVDRPDRVLRQDIALEPAS